VSARTCVLKAPCWRCASC